MVLIHIGANSKTKISIVGYKAELVEYKKDFDANIYLSPAPIGLRVSAVNEQRFYTNNRWPNAVVLKIEQQNSRR